MKDKVNLYKDYSLLNVYCYGCESLGHVLLECPRSNIHTTTFEIFKQIDFEDKRFRKSFIRFGRKKYNAISNLKLTQNAALKFMLERKNLIEIYSTLQQNNYPLDIVSSSDSIERDFDANLSDSSEEKKSYAETFVYSNEFSDSLEYLGPTWEGDARYSGEIIEKKRKYHQVVNFDRVKNFIYYFPHNNISNVIIKLEEMVQEKRKKESILIQKKKEEISE